jgi:hypothetical protein
VGHPPPVDHAEQLTMAGGWAPIPQWQIDQLNQLAQQNQLYGLDPKLLSVLVQEESGGKGGGINPEGYGGFFGLGASSTYPGGTTSPTLLKDTSPQSFAQQATIAASAFSNYLKQAGGNPVLAEQIYQTGKASGPLSPGAGLIASWLGGNTIAAGPAAAAAANATGTPQPGACDSARYLINAGPWHLINECQAKALMGGTLVGIGGFGILVAVALFVASGFGRRGPLETVSKVVPVSRVAGGARARPATTQARLAQSGGRFPAREAQARAQLGEERQTAAFERGQQRAAEREAERAGASRFGYERSRASDQREREEGFSGAPRVRPGQSGGRDRRQRERERAAGRR